MVRCYTEMKLGLGSQLQAIKSGVGEGLLESIILSTSCISNCL